MPGTRSPMRSQNETNYGLHGLYISTIVFPAGRTWSAVTNPRVIARSRDPHRGQTRLAGALGTFLVTTNAIENLIGTSRRISRNVKRWRSGEMIVRWTAIGLAQAEKHFRRVRGYRYPPLLARALRHDAVKIDQTEQAA
jgi:hypothetical protein